VDIYHIFRSPQGEGRLTGVESLFVRTRGCLLRCWFCDTPEASKPSDEKERNELSVGEIVERLDELGSDVQHVVITGGEPFLQPDLAKLTQLLRSRGKHITIETSGSLSQEGVVCDLLSVSPKLTIPQYRFSPDVLQTLLMQADDYQIKLVVDSPADCESVEDFLQSQSGSNLNLDRSKVMLMPQGKTLDELRRQEEWLAPYCLANNLTFCPRKQIEWGVE